MITTGIGPQGQSQFVVKYAGQRYKNIRGRIFSCEVNLRYRFYLALVGLCCEVIKKKLIFFISV